MPWPSSRFDGGCRLPGIPGAGGIPVPPPGGGGGGLDQLFGGGEDFDDSACVLRQQPVATVQVVAASEEDPRFLAGSEHDFQAAALALVVGQGDRIGSRCLGALIEDQHVRTGSSVG